MAFEILIGIALGLFLGWVLLQYAAMRTLQRIERSLAETMQRREQAPTLILARAEQQGETFYLWAIDDGRFLAQGMNSQEILTHLKERGDLPHSQVKVIEGDQDVLDRLRAADGV